MSGFLLLDLTRNTTVSGLYEDCVEDRRRLVEFLNAEYMLVKPAFVSTGDASK